MKNKVMRTFSFLMYLAVAAFSTNASAAVVLDFSTGSLGPGGTINYDGANATGIGINIGLMSVEGAGGMDGVYNADALLNFDTAANTIEIFGTVAGLGSGLGSTPSILLSGSFSSWDYGPALGGGEFFMGEGPDAKNADLLTALGIDPGTPFQHFGFSLESVNGNVNSTDIMNTAVPVPAAVWLFGSGLIGLIGIARRKK